MENEAINSDDYQDIIDFSNDLMNVTKETVERLKYDMDAILSKYKPITPHYLAVAIDKMAVYNPNHLIEYLELFEYLYDNYHFVAIGSMFDFNSKLEHLILLKRKQDFKWRTLHPIKEKLEHLLTIYEKGSIEYYVLHDDWEKVYSMVNERTIKLVYDQERLINLAVKLGAVRCFLSLFLILNREIDENTIYFAYSTGNLEIIQICERQLSESTKDGNVFYPDNKCVERLIRTHKNDILINIIEEKSLLNPAYDKIKYCWSTTHLSFNIEFFIYMYNNFGPFYVDENGHTSLYCSTFIELFGLENKICNEGIFKEMETINGDTSLIWATRHQSLPIIKKLVENAKVDINHVTKSGLCSALAYAGGRNSYECAKYLIEKGAKLDFKDKTGQSDLFYAARNDSLEVAELFISKGMDVNATDDQGRTPLFECATRNSHRVAKLLIKYGANVNHLSKYNSTSLINCAYRDSNDVALILLDNNADMNIVNKDGNTSLLVCIEKNSIEVAKLLIDRGCDFDIQNNAGESALSLAPKKSPEIWDYMKSCRQIY